MRSATTTYRVYARDVRLGAKRHRPVATPKRRVVTTQPSAPTTRKGPVFVRVSAAMDKSGGWSYQPAISGDGRHVVYHSNGFLEGSPDDAGATDVFAFDAVTGITQQVSTQPVGDVSPRAYTRPEISGDGRFVVYQSAPQIPPGSPLDPVSLVLWDRDDGRSITVAAPDDQPAPNGHLRHQSISADGRYVAFESTATNLTDDVVTAQANIFVWDRVTRQTQLVTGAPGGAPADSFSVTPVISADGRYVVFETRATNLWADTNPGDDVAVWDRLTGTFDPLIVSPAGPGSAGMPSISGNGRFVAFKGSTPIPHPVPGSGPDIYVAQLWDRWTDTVRVVSLTPDGRLPSSAGGNSVQVSADGGRVSYTYRSVELVPGTTSWLPEGYVVDLSDGRTQLIAQRPDGGETNAGVHSPVAMAADGRRIVFSSRSWNIVGEPEGAYSYDVFLRIE
ncbi:hypothetical protein KVF89_25190 [Nocardioides carbamazepini]|uniref:hypothetical protein n=1 Tax=Nocardioides carbamazepini TaxID=2854259 RepID=UPI00214A16B5|nr:hypothetical protein [Nocardioides carbamazepini]MCR1785857.1 hypothetical protein [Nocardioides carbamazepini]